MSMPQDYELPPGVIDALKANQKIEAIRLVREHFEVDLMQAKDIVEIAAEHLEGHPGVQTASPVMNSGISPMQPEKGAGRVVAAIIIGIIAYLLYAFMG
jgi:hypothetical protein